MSEFDDVSNLTDRELEELTGKLQRAVLQTKAEVEQEEAERRRAQEDLHRSTEEWDQRMVMEWQAIDVCDALKEWGGALLRNSELTAQLDDANRNTEQLRRTQQCLIDKEKGLHRQCQEVRWLLAEAPSHCKTADQPQEDRAMDVKLQDACQDAATAKTTPLPPPVISPNPSAPPAPHLAAPKGRKQTNSCSKCGERRTVATGHSQYKGRRYCPSFESLTKEQWMEKMRK